MPRRLGSGLMAVVLVIGVLWGIQAVMGIRRTVATPRAPAGLGRMATVAARSALPRMPGEFEHQDALMISAAQMIQFHPRLMADLVAGAGSSIEVICLVGDEDERRLVANRLTSRGLPSDSVHYIKAPMSTMWIRDWGPVEVHGEEGRPLFVDPHYEGNDRNRSDDLSTASIGQSLTIPVRDLALILEGGDLLSNGKGLGLTSRRLLKRNAGARGYDSDAVAELLRENLGFVDLFPLPSMVGEPTGHVDMFTVFVDAVTVVVGRYDPKVDPTNAAQLDRVAAALDGFETGAGTIKVERVTLPPRPDGLWRTYTNMAFANDRVLVPVYPDHSPELDAEALALYSRLLPGREVVGIDCTELIRRNGALHCVTLNLSRLAKDSTEPTS